MALNSRLLKIAKMVNKGARVADIGTDHAYLPVYLIKEGIATCAFACDVADGPLENARKNINKTATEGIVLRKGDGFSAVEPHEADTFILAGMGGDLIVKLIDSTPWIKNSKYQLLLQPMTSVEDLRRYLCQQGFEITEERAVTSQGRVYTVINASFTGNITACEPLFYYLGKLTQNIGEDEMAYIIRKRRLVGELAENIKNVDSQRHKMLLYVMAEIDKLRTKFNGN